jgi:hypothetical protein
VGAEFVGRVRDGVDRGEISVGVEVLVGGLGKRRDYRFAPKDSESAEKDLHSEPGG